MFLIYYIAFGYDRHHWFCYHIKHHYSWFPNTVGFVIIIVVRSILRFIMGNHQNGPDSRPATNNINNDQIKQKIYGKSTWVFPGNDFYMELLISMTVLL